MNEAQDKYVRKLLADNVIELRSKLRSANEALWAVPIDGGRRLGAAKTRRAKAQHALEFADGVLMAWNQQKGIR